MNKGLKVFLIVVLFAACIGYGGYKGLEHNKAIAKANAAKVVSFSDINKTAISEYGLSTDENVINVLLVGTDKRGSEDGYGRADAIVIATLDKKNGMLKASSLVEDTYLEIPGYGENKLSMAYSIGGISLLYKTIASNFGVALDYYIVADFDALKNVVDSVGGITINLDEYEARYMQAYYSDDVAMVVAGDNILNGNQTLAYLRIKQDSKTVFGRVDREHKVISALFTSISAYDVANLVSNVEDILGTTSTDIKGDAMRKLIAGGLSLSTDGISYRTFPLDGEYNTVSMDGDTVYEMDSELVKGSIYDFIYNPIEASAISSAE